MSCITLLSDLGLHDASVASAKGILMQQAPDANIIDISHHVDPFHLQQAAYLLSASCNHFPAASCHLVLCDIYSERNPIMLLCTHNEQYYIAPDNGVLPLAFGNNLTEVYKCTELADGSNFKDWMKEAATIAGKLQSATPENLGLEATTFKHAPTHWHPVVVDGSTVECHVIHIDRFENVVLNITEDEFKAIGKGRPFRIEFARVEALTAISNNYHDVREGEKLCRFNTAGYLEISMNRGAAASLFGLKLYRDQHIIYNTIKIYFS